MLAGQHGHCCGESALPASPSGSARSLVRLASDSRAWRRSGAAVVACVWLMTRFARSHARPICGWTSGVPEVSYGSADLP